MNFPNVIFFSECRDVYQLSEVIELTKMGKHSVRNGKFSPLHIVTLPTLSKGYGNVEESGIGEWGI